MADPTAVKNLKIKTGVAKRLAKERMCYLKEANQQHEKVEKLTADPAHDEYVLRKQKEVLQECRAMVPDCSRRLQSAIDDLQECLGGADAALKDTDEYKTANTQLDEAKLALDAK